MEKELFISNLDLAKTAFNNPQKVLMIGAHPDDIDINAGGLTAALIKNKSEVNWLICTDGGGGSWDSNIDKQSLIEIRKKEQLESANILGVSRVSFLDFNDGFISFKQEDLLTNLVKKIREIKPRIVITHDPWKQYDLHADHRAVGFMTSHAVILASNNTFFKDQLDQGTESHFTPIIGYFNPEKPNMWVDITAVNEQKEQAILAHASQFSDRLSFLDELRISSENLGKEIGVRQVEAFHIEINQ